MQPLTSGCRIWSIYIYIYINIYMPITSFDGPLLGFSKARSRGKDEKLRQERGKDEKEDKTLKRGMPPHQVWGFFWSSGPFSAVKLGKF